MTLVQIADLDPIAIFHQAGLSTLPDGSRVQWQPAGPYRWQAEHGGKTYRILLLGQDVETATLDIRLNGKRMQLQYETLEMRLQKKIGIEPGAVQKVTDLRAPMPGLIRALPISPGQQIAKGEPLIVLEAMKMENVIKSPADVVIASIAVQVGQAVEKNQVLVSFA
ncbi:MAG: acetyl-CoA carboxylase biotin carboxyl carrier protein subunit [Bacteroidetes bacterium]|jgi:acetyl/propionyl-CoA carboxylase alpha subunit|nr:acetyl-CoA carboxylase biotin carboxyl carrier protein subunit [Bacteroidota bacterium]